MAKLTTIINVTLYGDKEKLSGEVRCLIDTKKDSIDLSGNSFEAQMCDDSGNDCVRAIAYLVPADKIKSCTDFTIIIRSWFGEKEIKVDLSQLK